MGAYEEANPILSTALQVVGGTIPAVGASGLAAVKGASAAAPGALSTLMRNVFGVGLEASPSIGQLAKMGAAQGAIYGSGSAQEGDRLEGALKGAGVGTVAAPLLGKSLEKVVGYVGDKAAEAGIFNRLASQRGSLSSAPDSTSFSPEEIFLAKQLKNTPVEKVIAGASELATTSADDIPLFLPEAVGSPKVDRNAKFIANFEPSLDYSQSAIAGRTAGAQDRATSLFNSIAPDEGSFQGASRLIKAADDIVLEAEAQRRALSSPLYQDAYAQNPTIESPALRELISKDRVVANAIREVRKTANNADFPDNSTELLVKARQEIGDKVEIALKQGANREAADLTDTYNRLNEILHKSDALKQADEIFAGQSSGIDALNSTFIKNLRKVTDEKVNNIGQIFNMSDEGIRNLRNEFIAADKLDEWNAGIRAHLQNVVESTSEGSDFTRKIIGNTMQEKKLRAALGDSYDRVAKGLDFESRFFEGKNKYFAGSPTFGLGDEKAAFEKGVGILSKIKDRRYVDAIAGFFSGDMPDELAQEMAKIYFDPKRGSEAVNKIIPLLEQYAKNKVAAGAAGTLSGKTAVNQAAQSDAVTGQSRSPASVGTRTSPDQSTQLSQGLEEAARLLRLEKTKSQSNSSSFKPISGENATQPYGFINTLLKGEDMDMKPAQVIEEIKKNPTDHAIALMESNLDPKAKNPESSASGLFQLINKTAKDLGVKDVFDPAENYQGYLKLKQDTIDRFGTDDYRTIYASHYLGAPTLKKWMDGETLSETQQRQVEYLEKVLFPRLDKFYEKALREKNGVVEA